MCNRSYLLLKKGEKQIIIYEKNGGESCSGYVRNVLWDHQRNLFTISFKIIPLRWIFNYFKIIILQPLAILFHDCPLHSKTFYNRYFGGKKKSLKKHLTNYNLFIPADYNVDVILSSQKSRRTRQFIHFITW